MEEIIIHTPVIQLDQFLKWAGITDTGGQVKEMLAEGLITVNGIRIAERRKKLHPGDIIAIEGMGNWKVIAG